jgi:hypothetical protein
MAFSQVGFCSGVNSCKVFASGRCGSLGGGDGPQFRLGEQDVAGALKSGGVGLATYVVAALADTMNGALINAYQNNPQLNSQRAVVRQTDESVPQALSGYKPTVTATGQFAQEYTSQVAKTTVVDTAASPFGRPDCPRIGFGYSPSGISASVTQNISTDFKPRTGFAKPNPIPRRRERPCVWPSRQSC